MPYSACSTVAGSCRHTVGGARHVGSVRARSGEQEVEPDIIRELYYSGFNRLLSECL